jgi:hypothetical protein
VFDAFVERSSFAEKDLLLRGFKLEYYEMKESVN